MLVAFNKLDLEGVRERWPAFRGARSADGLPVLAISAVTGEGVPALRRALAELLPSAEELGAPPEPAGIVVHRFESAGDAFDVEHDADGALRVRGRRIERLAAQTNFDNDESAERFQRDLARLGIDAQLRRAGVRPGDTVRIGSVELEWEPELWEAG
jgi:GTP-binding protein